MLEYKKYYFPYSKHELLTLMGCNGTDLIQKYNKEQFIINVYYSVANVFRAVLRVCFWTGHFAIVPLNLTQFS